MDAACWRQREERGRIMTKQGNRIRRLVVLAVAFSLGVWFGPSAPLTASGGCDDTPVVTSLADSGAGSFRDAVANVCAGGTITFAVTGTIDLGSAGVLFVPKDMTIQGPGADQLTLRHDSSSPFPVLYVRNVVASISGLTIADGNNGSGSGGGIHNEGGTLTIDGVAFVNNQADSGGAVANVPGPTTGPVTIVRSTFSGNVAQYGGAVYHGSNQVAFTVANSTFSGNQASLFGGAVYLAGSGTGATFTNVTITSNAANLSDTSGTGGGIRTANGTVIPLLQNSIVAGNHNGFASPVADDVDGTLSGSSAANLIGVDTGVSGVSNGVNGNQVGSAGTPIDPQLGPLADNGGRTKTHALLAGSPAIDAGDNSLVDGTSDQRGQARILDSPDGDNVATVDIGAVEYGPWLDDIADVTIEEDADLNSYGFITGDPAGFDTVTATSSDQAIFTDASLATFGWDTGWYIPLVPVANASGTATITVTLAKTVDGAPVTGTKTFVVTVNPVGDLPAASNASTFVDQPTAPIAIARNAVDGAEITYFRFSGIANGTLALAGGGGSFSDPYDVPVSTVLGAGGVVFTPAADSTAAGQFSVQAMRDAAGNGLSLARTVSIAVSKHPTGISMSAAPNPSPRLSDVNVQFTVVSGGPTPTGSVTVTISGSSDTCSSTLSGGFGTCTLAHLADAGVDRVITASYSGDTVSAASTGTLLQTVNVCPKTPVVTNTLDSGAGSLRQAIFDACATDSITFAIPGPGPDTIVFNAPLFITGSKHLTIVGPTAKRLLLSGGNAVGIANVDAGAAATFLNLTMTAGAGTQGGAIEGYGDVVIANSTLSGNSSVGGGGAISMLGGTLAIYDSTLSGNSAPDQGGAIRTLVPTTLINATVTKNDGRNAIFYFDQLSIGNSIVANNLNNVSPTDLYNGGGTFTDLGNNLIGDGVDAKLGPLKDNGGPTYTHQPLANSPALDGGSNGLANTYNLTTDQRGLPRALPGPGSLAGVVDIGAFEAQASLRLSDTIFREDLPASAGFQVGSAGLITSVTAASGDQAILPDPLTIIGSGASRSLLVATAPDVHGTVPVTITVTAGGESVQGTLNVIIVDVPDTPSVTDATTNEDTQTSSGLVISRNPVDGPDVSHFQITGITGGTLYKTDGSTQIASGQYITVAEGNAGLRFTPAPDSFAPGHFGVQASVGTDGLGLGGGIVTATITVNPVADTPSVTNPTVTEDSVTSVQIIRNAVDGPEVTHFQITNIVGGTMLRSDGVTPIHDGDFIPIPFPDSGIDVRFTPFPDSDVTGHFTVRASIGATLAGLGPGSATSTITVTPIADTPSVTPATTFVNHQTTTGLRIRRNPVDGPEVTHFQIFSILHGTLYQNDGVTQIYSGDVITFAQGDAGLRFTPDTDYSGAASFGVAGATSATGGGLSPFTSASIAVNKYDTLTTITSHTPDPVDSIGTLTVGVSVASANGGPAPTGLVTVAISGSPAVCLVTAPAGSCVLVGLSGGDGQTITASYLGDTYSKASAATALQDVRACAAAPTVTNTNDSGPGSLRQVLADACDSQLIGFDIAGPGPHIITLTSGPLATSRSVGIFGPFDTSIRISGNHAGRVFDFSGVTNLVAAVTIMDGSAASGAGIRATGHLAVIAATLTGNTATVDGGAILGDGPDSTIELDTSTLSGNTAPNGSAVRADGPVGLFSSTVTANTGAGAAILNGGSAAVFDSIVTGNAGIAFGNTDVAVFQDVGGNLLAGDPMLGPLQDNGGPTFTHMPLAGSPAIDGASTAEFPIELVDQRGFSRAAGRAADPYPLSDIGAVEVMPTLDAIPMTTGSEDTPLLVPFNVGSSFIDMTDPNFAVASELDSLVATSSDPSLVPDTGLVITGSGESRTLTITPAPNRSGTATITVTATSTVFNALRMGNEPLTTTSSFVVTVAAVADTPSVSSTSTPVNRQTANGLVITRNPVDGPEVTHFRITAVSGGALFQNDGVTPVADGDFITAAQGAAGLRFTPTTDSVATGHFSVQASIGGTIAGLAGGVVTADIVVLEPSAIAVTSSLNPSQPGNSVSIQAVVTAAAAGTLTGTVTFADGATALAIVPLASGTAAFTTSALTLGVHHLTIAYSGDTVFASAATTFDQSVIGGRTVLTGADAGGGPHVRRFTALDGSVPPSGALNSFFAFDPAFSGGVRVAEGDVNADGQPDYIAAAGPGGAPEVRIYDGATGVLLRSFNAYEAGFTGGVYVAAADVDGDGAADVITGPGPGRAGEVKVFSGRDGSLLRDVTVFPGFTGGVRVAAGDVNGDGVADLIAGSGPGAATVTILNGLDGSTIASLSPSGGLTGGVFVAAADVTGDGYADLITGAGEGGAPQVTVFDIHAGGTAALTFNAFDPGFTGGVRVAAGDVNGDGHAEIIAGSGPGRAASIRVFDGVTAAQISEVQPYGAFLGGLFAATTAPAAEMVIDAPQPGTMRGRFTVSGWAFVDGGIGAGLAGIDVTAVPAGGGTPIALGAATLGDARPDVAAIFGAAYANAGFHFAVTGLAPGVYDLRVSARRAIGGQANLTRTVRITIGPDPVPLVVIDVPASGRLGTAEFVVAGWALVPGETTSPGIDAVDVWALPAGGGPGRYLGAATLGGLRPDVAAFFGSQFLASGYRLVGAVLPVGAWDIEVFPRATGAAAFGAPAIVRITVGDMVVRAIATGADSGASPQVRRFDAMSGAAPAHGMNNFFLPFDATFTGGVRVAEGDLNGDGVPETIAGAGPGAAPEVRIYDGATGTLLNAFIAFEPAFRGGVFVAAGDVNGDGTIDVIVGSGEGRAGEVKVFNGRDLSLLQDVSAFPGFMGGVRVAAGDVNGDGFADLVLGTGPGVAAQVRVLNAADGSTLRTISPYGAFLGGVYVAAGDVTGDGFADIVTGAGAGGGPHVQVFDGVTGAAVLGFFAFEPTFAGGVRVAVGDVTGDGRADLIVGSGAGRPATVRVFDATTAAQLNEVQPYGAGAATGLYVATAAPINRLALDTPAPNSTVHGAFPVSGWAYIEDPTTAGISAIDVWAIPAGGGSPAFLGSASIGDPRPDVAAIYGAQYGLAGFHLTAAAIAPGVYDLVISARSTLTGTFELVRVVRVTVN